MIRFPACALACVLAASPAFALYDGTTLRGQCMAVPRTAAHNFCATYVSGVADTFELARLGMNKPYCLPKTVMPDQLATETAAYLASHPEELHFSAALLVVKAINQNYGCDSR